MLAGDHGHGAAQAAHHPTGGWPVLLAVLLVAAALLVVAALRIAASGRRVRPARPVALAGGVLLVAAGLAPPVTAWAHADLRGHVVQHLLVGAYGPLLLAVGGPVGLLLAAGGPGVRAHVGPVLARRSLAARWLAAVGHPVVAAVLASGGLVVLHLTGLYALSTRSGAVHAAVLVHLGLSGYLLAWSVAGADPAPHRPGLPTRLAGLLVAGSVHVWLAKHLYARAPALPAGLDQPADVVREAARWMAYGGDLAEVALGVACLAAWYRRAGRRGARGALGTRDAGPAAERPASSGGPRG